MDLRGGERLRREMREAPREQPHPVPLPLFKMYSTDRVSKKLYAPCKC